jgi:hypothetical protein
MNAEKEGTPATVEKPTTKETTTTVEHSKQKGCQQTPATSRLQHVNAKQQER